MNWNGTSSDMTRSSFWSQSISILYTWYWPFQAISQTYYVVSWAATFNRMETGLTGLRKSKNHGMPGTTRSGRKQHERTKIAAKAIGEALIVPITTYIKCKFPPSEKGPHNSCIIGMLSCRACQLNSTGNFFLSGLRRRRAADAALWATIRFQ